MTRSLCPVLASALCLPFLTATATAAEPLRLPPTSKWQLNYADDSCRMSRAFGSGKDEVILVLDRFEPGPRVRVMLTGEPMKVRNDKSQLTIRFGPGEKPQESKFATGLTSDGKPATLVTRITSLAGSYDELQKTVWDGGAGYKVTTVDWSTIDASRYAAIRFMEVRIPLITPVILEVGPMDGAMKAFDACIDDLQRSWGVDPAAYAKRTRPPVPVDDPRDWLNTSDYPSKMLREGYQGVVDVRLSIDAVGKATGCHIQQSTRPEEFDAAVCRGLMARAKFLPALDAAGAPIASYYHDRVRFMIRL